MAAEEEVTLWRWTSGNYSEQCPGPWTFGGINVEDAAGAEFEQVPFVRKAALVAAQQSDAEARECWRQWQRNAEKFRAERDAAQQRVRELETLLHEAVERGDGVVTMRWQVRACAALSNQEAGSDGG